MEFDLSFLDTPSYEYLQHAIDGVNKACIHDPGAWAYVSAGNLREANESNEETEKLDPIARTVFREMEQDGHSGGSASWTISAVTEIAKNFPKWRDEMLLSGLLEMRNYLLDFIMRRYTEKFPGEDVDWFIMMGKVLHDMEYSYLAAHILRDAHRKTLQYLSKMENVSHLGNEVLLDMIEEYSKKL